MLNIKDSVAVITGGGGGIGFAIAKFRVENGGKVVLGDVAQEPLDKAEAELKAMNGEVATIICDVTDEDDCGKLAELVGHVYRNEALAGETFFIDGGLRLGSRG